MIAVIYIGREVFLRVFCPVQNTMILSIFLLRYVFRQCIAMTYYM